mmetsp:Transcript_941/g.2794  ORF Transcript_941/g.2794 Transcript_941/m.2794 type:complete len:252 (+) Transcript_941:2116-2871(+)
MGFFITTIFSTTLNVVVSLPFPTGQGWCHVPLYIVENLPFLMTPDISISSLGILRTLLRTSRSDFVLGNECFLATVSMTGRLETNCSSLSDTRFGTINPETTGGVGWVEVVDRLESVRAFSGVFASDAGGCIHGIHPKYFWRMAPSADSMNLLFWDGISKNSSIVCGSLFTRTPKLLSIAGQNLRANLTNFSSRGRARKFSDSNTKNSLNSVLDVRALMISFPRSVRAAASYVCSSFVPKLSSLYSPGVSV